MRDQTRHDGYHGGLLRKHELALRVRLGWVRLGWVRLGWVHLGWVRLGWVRPEWGELVRFQLRARKAT